MNTVDRMNCDRCSTSCRVVSVKMTYPDGVYDANICLTCYPLYKSHIEVYEFIGQCEGQCEKCDEDSFGYFKQLHTKITPLLCKLCARFK